MIAVKRHNKVPSRWCRREAIKFWRNNELRCFNQCTGKQGWEPILYSIMFASAPLRMMVRNQWLRPCRGMSELLYFAICLYDWSAKPRLMAKTCTLRYACAIEAQSRDTSLKQMVFFERAAERGFLQAFSPEYLIGSTVRESYSAHRPILYFQTRTCQTWW